MEEAPLRTKAMMRLGLRLGLRDIDICCLRFSQIDWKNDQIILEQEKTGVTIYLPLLEDVGNAIMDYILNERPTEAKKNPYVFVRRQLIKSSSPCTWYAQNCLKEQKSRLSTGTAAEYMSVGIR